MRKFRYITVGKILQELHEEGIPLTRVTFVRLEKRIHFPQAARTSGKLQWRVYSREQADTIKNKIRQEYNIDHNNN